MIIGLIINIIYEQSGAFRTISKQIPHKFIEQSTGIE